MTALRVDDVVDDAVAGAGIVDPDPDAFTTNLGLLVSTIDDQAGLDAGGVVATRAMLADALRKRIEISYWAHEHPEITAEPIAAPLFLTGLPRSGTTYFQYLFDRDPAMRQLRTWEGDRPCPPPGFHPDAARARRERAATRAAGAVEDGIRAEIAKIHLSDVDGPQECVAILDQTFANPGMLWTHRVPAYLDLLLGSIDLERAYAHHKLEMQLLQWRSTPRQWVLKWPCHLLALDAILAVHPDARFVVTHRDPVQALASNCSLTRLLRPGFSGHVEPSDIGREMEEMILVYLRRLVDFDERHGDRVVHVDYRRVVDAPEVVMTETFDALGLDMTDRVRDSIGEWRRANPPGKRGVHDYRLEEYGLDADLVAEEYAFYTDRYDVPSEAERTP